MHTRAPRRLRRLAEVLLLLVVASLAIGVAVVAGSASHGPAPVPETAFKPVILPPEEGLNGGVPPVAPVLPSAFGPIVEPEETPPAPPERPNPSLPASTVLVVPMAPPPKPRPAAPPASGVGSTTHVLVGRASWYCRAGYSPCTVNHPDVGGIQAYAAAGPKLRAALGSGWRGRIVSVDGIRVQLIDWCQCYQGEPSEKLLDLYYDVFALTGSAVTIRW